MQALTLTMRQIIDARPADFDVNALDVPWRVLSSAPKVIRFGLITDLKEFPLHPPVRRALDDATNRLRDAGHEIVQIPENETHIIQLLQLASQFLALDGIGPERIQASGEPFVPLIAKVLAASKRLDQSYLDDVRHLEGLRKCAALNVKRQELQDVWRALWLRYNLDAVITAPCHHTAVPHETFLEPPLTFFLNTLDVRKPVI